MGTEEFIEAVRVGVVSGVFSVSDAVKYLTANEWQTTKDVPIDRRAQMLKDLTK